MTQAPTTSLLRSVVTLFTGTLLAQAVPFLFAPLIARLYNADQFAVFGTLLAVFNILAVVVAGRYDQAVVLPPDPARAMHLVKGALLVVLCISLTSGLLLFLFGRQLEQSLGLPGLQDVIGPLILLVMLGGVQLVLMQWMLRVRAYGALARQKVAQAIGITVFTLLFGWLAARNGLVWGYLIGWSLYTAITVWTVVRRFPLLPGWEWSGIRAALVAYRAWPLHNAWPAVLNATASGMAVIYMASYFTAEETGQHNFARQYLLVPISMVSVALGQVLFERTATRVRDGVPIRAGLRVVILSLLAAALIIAVIITLFGEPLFAWLFGERWRMAGQSARILVWGYAAQLVAGPLGTQLIALGRVKAAMVFPVLFASLLGILSFAPHGSAMRFMGLLSATEVVAYGAYALWVWHHVRQHDLGVEQHGPGHDRSTDAGRSGP